jgi:hypothetical protein
MPKHPTTLIGSATLAAIAAARSIAEASICTDVNAMALRPDEACGTLVDVLGSMLALLPESERTPPKRRTTLQTVVKKLKRHVACAAADPTVQAFRAHVFSASPSKLN